MINGVQAKQVEFLSHMRLVLNGAHKDYWLERCKELNISYDEFILALRSAYLKLIGYRK